MQAMSVKEHVEHISWLTRLVLTHFSVIYLIFFVFRTHCVMVRV